MKAFLWSFPIGILGGLIGLGGAEFRLPVLTRVFGYKAADAIPLNLAISLLTVAVGFLSRLGVTSVASLVPNAPVIGALGVASMVGAFMGTACLYRITEFYLDKVVMTILGSIGGLLIVESYYGVTAQRLTEDALINVVIALCLGFAIGVVSSLLGVAGGELIIPSLMLVFGMEVKEAGTASVMISTVTVLVGCVRYYRSGAYNSGRDVTLVVVPMSIASVVGAAIGGLALSMVSVPSLKFLLGTLLMVSAFHMFRPPRLSRAR